MLVNGNEHVTCIEIVNEMYIYNTLEMFSMLDI